MSEMIIFTSFQIVFINETNQSVLHGEERGKGSYKRQRRIIDQIIYKTRTNKCKTDKLKVIKSRNRQNKEEKTVLSNILKMS